ncbi:MAG TPA: class I SAM-dependent methyltransferase [Hyphomicrobiaceae bacterium]|nr:class I SAM-dependent methyltransferase [Hyphomicrobiaceae bacterium]
MASVTRPSFAQPASDALSEAIDMATLHTELTKELLAYILSVSQPEPPAIKALRERADTLQHAQWRATVPQAQLIALLLKITNTKRCIEVGTFVGYSTLWLATSLPSDGLLVTCDIAEEFPAIGKPFWEIAGVAHLIDLRIGAAKAVLEQLLVEEGEETFDAAFIDANKKEYLDYYEACLKLVRPSGLLVIDNVLWGGKVIDAHDTSEATTAIRQLNTRIRNDPRVEAVVLSFNDGLTIARKR